MKHRLCLLSRIICLFTFFGCFQISAFDVTGWVAKSSRFHNPVILDLVMTENIATSQKILKALAQRDDLYCEDIIERVYYQESTGRELLLEAYFTQIMEAGELRILIWIDTNPATSDLMIRNLSSFSNPYLKAHVLKLIPHARREDSKSYLMREAVEILSEIETRNGYLGPGHLRELLELLRIIADFRDPDFLEYCISLSEKSRQEIIVTRSRTVAGLLAFIE